MTWILIIWMAQWQIASTGQTSIITSIVYQDRAACIAAGDLMRKTDKAFSYVCTPSATAPAQ